MNTETRIKNLEKQMAYLIRSVCKDKEYQGYDIEATRKNTADNSRDIASTQESISDTWNPRVWNVNEYCIYNNTLWKCLVANSAVPSEGAEWTKVNLVEMLIDLNNRVSNLESEE